MKILVFRKFKKIARGRFSHSIKDDLLAIGSLARSENYEAKILLQNNFSKYNDRKYCVAFPMARVGLYYTLKAMGAQKNQKILMPPITIKAMLDVVLAFGLEPVFLDIDIATASFEPSKLEETCEREKPEFILLTYLFGVGPEIDHLTSILKKHQVRIIEDFSQGLNLGQDKPWSGRIGEVSIYSSSAVKQFDTYGGGFVLTDDLSLKSKLENFAGTLPPITKTNLLRKFAATALKNSLTRTPLFQIILFPMVWASNRLGISYFDRFVGNRSHSPIEKLPENWFVSYSNYQASVGLKKLSKITESDHKRLEYAREVINRAKNSTFITGAKISDSVFWQLLVVSNQATKLRKALLSKGIDSSFSSLILLTELSEYGISVSTPNAKKIFEQGVYLPCYADLTTVDAIKIAKIVSCHN